MPATIHVFGELRSRMKPALPMSLAFRLGLFHFIGPPSQGWFRPLESFHQSDR